MASYGYLRVTKDGTLIGRGDWRGFRLPLDRRVTQFTLNGQAAKTTRAGPDLVYGDASPAAAAVAPLPAECPFPATVVPPGPLRMFARDRRELTLEIKNTLPQPLSGYVEFSAPEGIAVTPPKLEFQAVAPERPCVYRWR